MMMFGNTPVPWVVSWTSEEKFYVGPCKWADSRLAICQTVAPGVGKPKFGSPHSQRQREAIHRGLCDLCARSLKNRTKVSLSHASLRTNGADGLAIMQVEPMLHFECAQESLKHCPSLRRDIKAGTVEVRRVSSYRVQLAIMAPEFISHYVPGYIAKPTDRIIGAAKIELIRADLRGLTWLERNAST